MDKTEISLSSKWSVVTATGRRPLNEIHGVRIRQHLRGRIAGTSPTTVVARFVMPDDSWHKSGCFAPEFIDRILDAVATTG